MPKIRNTLASLAIGVALAAMPVGAAFAADSDSGLWVTPVIEGYGAMHPAPDAALQPDPAQTYKIVFDTTKGAEKAGVNTALWHIARAVNLYGSSGVDKEHRKFVAVIHGPATPIVLTNAAYEKKYGKANPNLDLISKLEAAGVTFYVCGQAAADNGIAAEDINPAISLTLSALVAVPSLEAEGYSLFPM